MSLLRHMYESVVSRTWMGHVTHMNESCHTFQWVQSQKFMFILWTTHPRFSRRQKSPDFSPKSPDFSHKSPMFPQNSLIFSQKSPISHAKSPICSPKSPFYSQKSPISSPQSPVARVCIFPWLIRENSATRALSVLKRALFPCLFASKQPYFLFPRQIALFLLKRALLLYFERIQMPKEYCLSSKEPCFLLKESFSLSKNPCDQYVKI